MFRFKEGGLDRDWKAVCDFQRRALLDVARGLGPEAVARVSSRVQGRTEEGIVSAAEYLTIIDPQAGGLFFDRSAVIQQLKATEDRLRVATFRRPRPSGVVLESNFPGIVTNFVYRRRNS